jgi:CheY-like chemotaxis protein
MNLMDLPKGSVWIIDDDSDEHFLLKRVLHRAGVCSEPRSFLLPQEAIRAYSECSHNERPVLLLVDMNMPGMTGLECVAQLEAMAISSQFALPFSILLSSALPYHLMSATSDLKALLGVSEKPLTATILLPLLNKGV